MNWTDHPSIAAALMTAADCDHADVTQLTALGSDGTVVATLSPRQWDLRARAVAVRLAGETVPGDRVLVPMLGGLDFHVAFMACLYVGAVAVPVPPLPGEATRRGGDRRTDRLRAIVDDCRPTAIITVGPPATDTSDDLLGLRPVAVEDGDVDASATTSWDAHPRAYAPDAVALLQYTSGSTADPRGVILTHRNLVVNRGDARDRAQVGENTTVVLWLPLFHDMGLGSSIVLPLVSGARVVNMEPTTFIRRPRLWLQAITDADDVYSSAPDFAFHLCVDRIDEQSRDGLDLSGWRAAVNGSEPVRAATLERFVEAFGPAGFKLESMRPSYGLAESTLVVSMGDPLSEVVVRPFSRQALAEGRVEPPMADDDVLELVGCGHPTDHVTLRVVDPDHGRELPSGRVGELWVASPSNGLGYWGRPDESAATFEATLADDPDGDRHVRTGDLGFVHHGEVFIAGRLKDVLIIGGENFYPQDAESAAKSAHAIFETQVCAAWPIDADDRPVVGIALETREEDVEIVQEALRSAARAVARVIPARVRAVALPRYTIPRTTSGKVRRQACGTALAEGSIIPTASWDTA